MTHLHVSSQQQLASDSFSSSPMLLSDTAVQVWAERRSCSLGRCYQRSTLGDRQKGRPGALGKEEKEEKKK
jgi:hypothetical protein